MKKIMILFTAILFAGSVLAYSDCSIPEGWSYYTTITTDRIVGQFVPQNCKVIRKNVQGNIMYKVCFHESWCDVRRANNGKYYFYYSVTAETYTFSM